MGKPESAVEKHLRRRVLENGGFIEKWESSGSSGLPDRTVVLNGYAIFVETKAPGEKARELQRITMKEIRMAGGDAIVLDTKDKIDKFVELIMSLPPRKPVFQSIDDLRLS